MITRKISVLGAVFLLLSHLADGQPVTEMRTFMGKFVELRPGYSFAMERLVVDLGDRHEVFMFPPQYGQLIQQSFQPGSEVHLTAAVNLRLQEARKTLEEKYRTLPFFLSLGTIKELKVNEHWITLREQDSFRRDKGRVFINERVTAVYAEGDFQKGMMCEGGRVAYNFFIERHQNPFAEAKVGSQISFVGYPLPAMGGFVYPLRDVKAVYHSTLLRYETGHLQSFMYKQNYVCMGLKFKRSDGSDLILSFPTERAAAIKKFLRPTELVHIFHSSYLGPDPFPMAELHALVQGRDTLRIEEIGFYGGVEGKLNYRDIEVSGKISKVNFTKKGNVLSIVMDTRYLVEIDGLLSQQLGFLFRKGAEISIVGKERLRKEGELFSRDYVIVTPDKVTIGGKTFSAR